MVARAFRHLGHEVAEYAKMYESNWWVAPSNILNNGVSTTIDATCGGYEFVEPYMRGEFDLHVYMEMNDPEPQYTNLREVRAEKRVGWFFDISYCPDPTLRLCDHMQFDHVFCANPDFLPRFAQPASFLPYAADSKLHVRDIADEHPIFYGLVGSKRGDRKKLVSTLQKVGVRAELISDVFKTDYVDTLARCAVSINQNPPEGRGLLNMRTFEAPAAGSVLLCQDDDHIDEVFLPGVECITYQDTGSLVSICQNFGTRDFINMRKAGQERVLNHHLYEHRAQEILDVMGF